jgi:putative transposase
VVTPEQRRTAVTSAMVAADVSERRACRDTGFARSSQRYESTRPPRTELRERLHTLATVRPRWGYRRLYVLLCREGYVVNRKLVQRVYGEEGLHVRRRKRKRVAVPRVPLPAPAAPNEQWSMDFVSDALSDGRKFRALTLVDDFSRESPAIEVDFSLPGERVVRGSTRWRANAATRRRSFATTDLSSPAKRSISGRTRAAARSGSFNRASRFRTPSPRASMAGSATSVSTRAGS